MRQSNLSLFRILCVAKGDAQGSRLIKKLLLLSSCGTCTPTGWDCSEDFYLLPLGVMGQVWHLLQRCFGGLPWQHLRRVCCTRDLSHGTAAALSHLPKQTEAEELHLLLCRKFHSWFKSYFNAWMSCLLGGARQKLLKLSFAWMDKLCWMLCFIVVVIRRYLWLEIEFIPGLNYRAMGWADWLIPSKKKKRILRW